MLFIPKVVTKSLAPHNNGSWNHSKVFRKSHPWCRNYLCDSPLSTNDQRRHVDKWERPPSLWLKVLLVYSDDVRIWILRLLKIKLNIDFLSKANKGCDKKSVYLQIPAIFWKFTDLIPHPLIHVSLISSIWK